MNYANYSHENRDMKLRWLHEILNRNKDTTAYILRNNATISKTEVDTNMAKVDKNVQVIHKRKLPLIFISKR